MGHNHVDIENQVGCQSGKPRVVFLRPPVFDDEVCALDIAVVAQTRAQCCDAVWITSRIWGRAAQEPVRATLPDCCARAASGHATAAPPSAASNSRRPMVTVMRPSRARVRKEKDTTPRAYSLAVQSRAECRLLPPLSSASGSEAVRLRTRNMFSGLPPKADLRSAR